MHDGESLQKPHTSAHRNARQSGAAVCLSGAMAARFCPVPTGVRRFENLRCIHLLTCRRCERQHRNRSAQQREQNQIGEAIATNPQNTSLLMVSAGLSHTESHRKPQKARKHFGTQSTPGVAALRLNAVQCSCVPMPYTVAFCSLSEFCSPRIEMHLHRHNCSPQWPTPPHARGCNAHR